MKISKFLATAALLALSFQAFAAQPQQDPGAHYQIQDLLPEKYHPQGVDPSQQQGPTHAPSTSHFHGHFREYDLREYERHMQNSRRPYEVVPGVVFYPSPYPRYYPYRRIHDPCFIHPLRPGMVAGEILAQSGQDDPTLGQVGAASGAYIAGRIIGGSCR